MNEELETLFAKYKKDQEEPQTLAQRFAGYLGSFVAYLMIITLLFFCWNYALVAVFPMVPPANFFQVAGLWYLSNVLMKRD
jgi:hypothetical protein